MLILPIKKQWFEMIANGEKKEEYREVKEYYNKRFNKIFPYNIHQNKEGELWYLGDRTMPQEIIFRNGYNYNSPSIKCLCKLKIGYGKKEWGAKERKKYYILEILEIIEIKNWNNPNPKIKEAMAVAALPATPPITPNGDIQEEIRKSISKQFAIGIDIGEGVSRSGQSIKNTMMFGG